jgi:23S rRNA U2552 (ribose-2'-O)-methylase RlmE/FtsJ
MRETTKRHQEAITPLLHDVLVDRLLNSGNLVLDLGLAPVDVLAQVRRRVSKSGRHAYCTQKSISGQSAEM